METPTIEGVEKELEQVKELEEKIEGEIDALKQETIEAVEQPPFEEVTAPAPPVEIGSSDHQEIVDANPPSDEPALDAQPTEETAATSQDISIVDINAEETPDPTLAAEQASAEPAADTTMGHATVQADLPISDEVVVIQEDPPTPQPAESVSTAPDSVTNSIPPASAPAIAPDVVNGAVVPVQILPLYQCHKKVRAAKIIGITPLTQDGNNAAELGLDIPDPACPNQGHLNVKVDKPWLTRNPAVEIGGYFVEYQEGDKYTSYSPAGPFESGYTLVQ